MILETVVTEMHYKIMRLGDPQGAEWAVTDLTFTLVDGSKLPVDLSRLEKANKALYDIVAGVVREKEREEGRNRPLAI